MTQPQGNLHLKTEHIDRSSWHPLGTLQPVSMFWIRTTCPRTLSGCRWPIT